MQDVELINLWKAYDSKLEESLSFNRKNAADITKMKVRSLLLSMTPLKIFTIIVGIAWVALVDMIIIATFREASLFFLVSAIIQVLLTKLAIGVYLYQLILIQQVDINAPVVDTQTRLARLRSSTLWVTRLLFLQMPVWTTFFLTTKMFANASLLLILLPIIITLVFTFAGVWLFVNINLVNKDKKWFRLIFEGKEWTPVIRSLEMLEQLDEYNDKKA